MTLLPQTMLFAMKNKMAANQLHLNGRKCLSFEQSLNYGKNLITNFIFLKLNKTGQMLYFMFLYI